MRYANRKAAGCLLGKKLQGYALRPDVVVLALPRGGVPVAYEVSRALHVPMDVFVVRKLGVPGHEELAMGAIASGGTVVANPDVIDYMRIDQMTFDQVAERERQELRRREESYRQGRKATEVRGKVCLLVDDGIATGASMLAAVQALRSRDPQSVIVTSPVAAPPVPSQFARVADGVVCLQLPREFNAVGAWYEDFRQISDEEVRDLLDRIAAEFPQLDPPPPAPC
jgi:putative phosphoribosyl transferase